MTDVLGPGHPLTRASLELDAALRQMSVVAALLGGSLGAALAGAAWAISVAVAAGLVLTGTAALAALRAQTRRDRALDLVIAGPDRLQLAVLQRQRRRLASPRTRRSLARTLESMVEETLHRSWTFPRSSRPPLYVPLIAAAQDELRELAALLRSRSAAVRGIALCERIVTLGTSPLYGRDLAPLRTELHRARFLLAGDES